MVTGVGLISSRPAPPSTSFRLLPPKGRDASLEMPATGMAAIGAARRRSGGRDVIPSQPEMMLMHANRRQAAEGHMESQDKLSNTQQSKKKRPQITINT